MERYGRERWTAAWHRARHAKAALLRRRPSTAALMRIAVAAVARTLSGRQPGRLTVYHTSGDEPMVVTFTSKPELGAQFAGQVGAARTNTTRMVLTPTFVSGWLRDPPLAAGRDPRR